MDGPRASFPTTSSCTLDWIDDRSQTLSANPSFGGEMASPSPIHAPELRYELGGRPWVQGRQFVRTSRPSSRREHQIVIRSQCLLGFPTSCCNASFHVKGARGAAGWGGRMRASLARRKEGDQRVRTTSRMRRTLVRPRPARSGQGGPPTGRRKETRKRAPHRASAQPPRCLLGLLWTPEG